MARGTGSRSAGGGLNVPTDSVFLLTNSRHREFFQAFDILRIVKRPLCPKATRSPLTYRARAGAPRTIANARRSGAGACPGMVSRSPGGAHHRLLYQQRRSRHTPRPPKGEGGRGEGADHRPPSRPKGRAHRRPGAGGPAPGERAPGESPARAQEARPAGRRQGGASRTTRTKQQKQFC